MTDAPAPGVSAENQFFQRQSDRLALAGMDAWMKWMNANKTSFV
jgi:hypothetical protein